MCTAFATIVVIVVLVFTVLNLCYRALVAYCTSSAIWFCGIDVLKITVKIILIDVLKITVKLAFNTNKRILPKDKNWYI